MSRLLACMLASFLFANLCAPHDDVAVQKKVERWLRSSDFRNVHVSVTSGDVVLSGTVPRYRDKLRAVTSLRKLPCLCRLEDRIVVAPTSLTDDELKLHLQKLIAENDYLQLRQLPTGADAVLVEVKGAVVTLSGQNVDPLYASIALSTVQGAAGVKGLVNCMRTKQFSTIRDSPLKFKRIR